jgi:hypothetical protein
MFALQGIVIGVWAKDTNGMGFAGNSPMKNIFPIYRFFIG